MEPFFTRLCLLLSVMLPICWQLPALAQQTPPRPLDCRTADLTDGQKRDLDAAARFAFQVKKAQNNKAFTGITYIPIRPHIIRRSDGTGGMTLTRMNNLMAQTNRYYLLSGSGVQFYFAGASPHYIDNTAQYDSFSESSLPNGTDAADAMNMYFIFSPGPNANYGGYAYYPTNNLQSTRSVITDALDDYLGRIVIPHELGHNFNLYHTFGNTNSGNSAELVTRGAGANCSSAGDLLCDTPADPYTFPGGNIQHNSQGCQVYAGTGTDANGDTYNPQMGNIMSYYANSNPACLRFFTAGQYDRMQAGLALRQTHTAYSLNAPATPVTAPTNLVLSLVTGGAVQLTWQDNATNEMGYFAERSASASGPFAAVGGVPPNTTTFADQTATPGTAYYYRVRPSNTTTGNLSPVQTITTLQAPCLPTYAIGCSDNNGLTGLILNGDTLSRNSGCSLTGYQNFTQRHTAVFAGQTYSFTAQLGSASSNAGLAIWIDADRNNRFDTVERRFQSAPTVAGQITRTFTIPAGLAPGPVGMRVMTTSDPVDIEACGSYRGGEAEDYTLIIISTCPLPDNLLTSSRPFGAQLTWANAGDGLHYDLQWRPAGSGSWNYVNDVPVPTYNLTGLQPGTDYDWQIRTRCDPVSQTAFTTPVLFTTLTTCPEPTSLTATSIDGNSAQLRWQNPAGGSGIYDLQWRKSASQTWNTVSGIVGNTYSLTGLQSGLFYNWQVRTVCTTVSNSYYTPTVPFVTGGCQPVFSVGCNYGSGTGLNSLTVNGTALSTNSGCSVSGYSQFTTVATVSPGRSYSLAGTLLNQTTTAGFGIWADLNRNGTFDSNEIVFGPGQLVTGAFTGAVAIPATLTPGSLAIRIVLLPNAYPGSGSACGSFTGGEAEDYWLEVVSATGCVLPALTLSGSATIATGLSAPLTVLLTGNQPVSFTIGNNGTAQTISVPGSSMAYYYLPANPSATTTYFPLSVSNACGTGIGSGTAVITVQNCDAPTGLAEAEQTTSSVRLTWQPLAVATGYTVIYRQAGSPTATTATANGTNSLALYSLTFGAVYEWQVSSTCPYVQPVFSPVRSFTMNCPAPFSLSEVVTGLTSVQLQWSWPGSNTVEVQYRPAGVSGWTSTTLAGGFSYSLGGLVTDNLYEWRIRTFCSGTGSEYSAIRTFTIPCNAPASYGLNPTVTATTARLTWYAGNSVLYDVRWRVKSQTEEPYTIISGIPGGFSAYATGVANLTGLTNGTAYEWQVRTVCSAMVVSAFGPVQSFTTGCGAISSAYYSNLTSGGALLAWNSSNTDSRYNLVYRMVGSPTSTTISALTATAYQLNGLTNGSVYEFAVQVVCSDGSLSAFSAPRSFTTQCPTPGWLFANTPGSNTIRLGWATTATDTYYELVYRVVGSPTSATISSLTVSPGQAVLSYNLTGLLSDTAYEWQVRTVCSDGNRSAFTQLQSFNTAACTTPETPVEAYVLSTSARLTWGGQEGLRYEVQWRPTGSATWPSSATVTATESSYLSYTLTGLTNNTGYEWRVSTRCTDNTQSAYTQPRSFTTNCPVPNNFYVMARTDRTAVLNFSAGYYYQPLPGLRYDVQYQPTGSTGWTLVSNINSTTLLLTSLSAATDYTGQVRTICADGSVSAFGPTLMFTTLAVCPSVYTLKDGNWSDSSVWSCGWVPTAVHEVEIRHVVTLSGSGYYPNQARRVGYGVGGKLLYLPGGSLRLGQ